MAMMYGKIEPFKEGEEEWRHYCERLEFFFKANAIDDTEKKKAILLSVCGPKTYQLIRTLCSPDAVDQC